jgi:hypothetical protein
MQGDEETQLFQRMTQAFDAPAFIRRARNVEGAWQAVLERCRKQRRSLAEMPAMLLARLFALAGSWERLTAFCSQEFLAELRKLHAEWSPQLKLPVSPARQDGQIRRALAELAASLDRFNSQWTKFVGELDLGSVNELREAYNRYYVLEKECATRSPRTARASFTPLAPLTIDDVLREFPRVKAPGTA